MLPNGTNHQCAISDFSCLSSSPSSNSIKTQLPGLNIVFFLCIFFISPFIQDFYFFVIFCHIEFSCSKYFVLFTSIKFFNNFNHISNESKLEKYKNIGVRKQEEKHQRAGATSLTCYVYACFGLLSTVCLMFGGFLGNCCFHHCFTYTYKALVHLLQPSKRQRLLCVCVCVLLCAPD